MARFCPGINSYSGVIDYSALVKQGYRFALDPTREQEALLGSFTGASRFWFNQGLALVKERLDRRAAGEEVRVPWSYKALCTAFKGDAIKDELAPWRAQVVAGSYQAGLEQLGNALRSFSRGRRAGRQVGFPRFRAKGRCKESVIFQRPRIKDARHVEFDRRLGPIRSKERMTKLVRLLAEDEHARVLRATISRHGSRWFVSFSVERSPKMRRARQPHAAVGVDVGLARLATLSTGELFANARPLKAVLRRLRRMQRQLDRQCRAANPANYDDRGRTKLGGRNWAKSRRMLRTEERIRRLHEHVANMRREQAHQLTTALTREYGVIGVETLNVRGMQANRRLARHIADVGWGTIVSQLSYKTRWSTGSLLVAAAHFYPSSKTCSACGVVKAKLGLGERVFSCHDPACGLVLDRDLNAALNLARIAVQRAHARGLQCYVAATGAGTLNARRGQVSLIASDEHSPLKREGSPTHPSAARRRLSQRDRHPSPKR
jgi:putative transposase